MRIVAESLQPGVRVVDVAAYYNILPIIFRIDVAMYGKVGRPC